MPAYAARSTRPTNCFPDSANAAQAYLTLKPGQALSSNYTHQLTLYGFSKSEAASAAGSTPATAVTCESSDSSPSAV